MFNLTLLNAKLETSHSANMGSTASGESMAPEQNNSAAYKNYFQQAGDQAANADVSLDGGRCPDGDCDDDKFTFYDFLNNLVWALNGGTLWEYNNTGYSEPPQLIGTLGITQSTKLFSLFSNSNRITKEVGGLIKAGNTSDKGGFTAVGRALQKHGSRTGTIYPKATGNVASINAQGEAVLKGILTNPNATIITRHHARFGNIIDIQIPGGQGARFSADGKKFIHFLEP